MNIHRKILICLALAVLAGLTTTLSFSGEDTTKKASFSDLIATTSETHLLLFGMIKNGFTEEMTAALQSGVPVHFSFFVELSYMSPTEKDSQLTALGFRHILRYDTLKDNYQVELGESNNKVVLLPTLEEAKQVMGEINGLKVLPLTELATDSTYQLRIRAELYEKTLPESLHRILPFLSWWDNETDWHTLEFNY